MREWYAVRDVRGCDEQIGREGWGVGLREISRTCFVVRTSLFSILYYHIKHAKISVIFKWLSSALIWKVRQIVYFDLYVIHFWKSGGNNAEYHFTKSRQYSVIFCDYQQVSECSTIGESQGTFDKINFCRDQGSIIRQPTLILQLRGVLTWNLKQGWQ